MPSSCYYNEVLELLISSVEKSDLSDVIQTFQYENVQVDVVFVYIAISCSKKRVKYLFSKISENFFSPQMLN